jgi:hypothetical protein
MPAGLIVIHCIIDECYGADGVDAMASFDNLMMMMSATYTHVSLLECCYLLHSLHGGLGVSGEH